VVSEVVGVHQMNRGDVQEVSERLVSSPYLLGISDLDGSPMLMLSVPRLVSISEIPEGVL
jgi:chemotaxis signal transduction protein